MLISLVVYISVAVKYSSQHLLAGVGSSLVACVIVRVYVRVCSRSVAGGFFHTKKIIQCTLKPSAREIVSP